MNELKYCGMPISGEVAIELLKSPGFNAIEHIENIQHLPFEYIMRWFTFEAINMIEPSEIEAVHRTLTIFNLTPEQQNIINNLNFDLTGRYSAIEMPSKELMIKIIKKMSLTTSMKLYLKDQNLLIRRFDDTIQEFIISIEDEEIRNVFLERNRFYTPELESDQISEENWIDFFECEDGGISNTKHIVLTRKINTMFKYGKGTEKLLLLFLEICWCEHLYQLILKRIEMTYRLQRGINRIKFLKGPLENKE